MMKLARTVAILLLCSGAAFGQADVKPQSQCRPLQSGDFIASNESIVGTGSNMMVCSHSAKVEAVQPAVVQPTVVRPAAVQRVAVQPAVVQPTKVQPIALSTSDATPAPTVAGVGPRGGPRVTSGAAPLVQFALGYQYDSVNLSGYGSSTSRVNTNGVFMQAKRNVSSYLAVIGDVDAIYKSQVYLFTYAGGVQANPISNRDWTPFVRATIGAGTIHVQNYGTTTGFAWQFGGGLDYHFHKERRLGLRLLQFDYGQVRKQGVSLNSIKLGTGITF
jgi:hypothetical protein